MFRGGRFSWATRTVGGFKLSVGFAIECLVSNPVRPIRSVHFEHPTDRLAEKSDQVAILQSIDPQIRGDERNRLRRH